MVLRSSCQREPTFAGERAPSTSDRCFALNAAGVKSLKLQKLAARLRAGSDMKAEADQAQHALLAVDIKRFLERPVDEGAKMMPTASAPPGAPIGDLPQGWRARPPYER